MVSRLAITPPRAATHPGPAPAPEPQADAPPADWTALYGLAANPFEGDGPFIAFASRRRPFDQIVQHLLKGQGMLLLLGEPGSGKTALLNAAAEAAIAAGLPRPLLWKGRGSDLPNIGADPKIRVLLDNTDHRTASALAARGVTGVAAIMTAEPLTPERREPDLPWVRLAPLPLPELQIYVERRLWIAGGATRRLIVPDALPLVLQQARGLPERVNRLMEAVLTTGFIRGDPIITRKTVTAALGAPVRPRPARTRSEWIRPAELHIPAPPANWWHIAALVLFCIGLTAFLVRALVAQ